MMRMVFLAIGLSLVTSGLHAQGAIRTGEHGAFTRVVIPIGVARAFTLEGEGTSRRVVLDPPADFDVSDVRRPLSAGRLLTIDDQGSGVLSLLLGCNCEVEAYRYDGAYAVLDIFDPSAAENAESTAEIELPGDAPTRVRAEQFRRPYVPVAPLDPQLLQSTVEPVTRLTGLQSTRPPEPAANNSEAVQQNTVALVASEGSDPSAVDLREDDLTRGDPVFHNDQAGHLSPDSAERMGNSIAEEGLTLDSELSETVDALAEQLARAAASGLLETALAVPDSDQESASEQSPPATMSLESETNDPSPESLPVRAANAFDIAGDRDGGLAGISAALSCSAPIRDMTEWSEGLGFEQELGGLRLAAFDSHGMLRRAETIELARYYIYHGFGAEAAAWLTQLDDPPVAELAMAHYLDDRPGPNFPPVETIALCSGLNLLWRFIDAPEFPELSLSQRQDMRLTFSGLPIGLRRLLGPNFVRRLAAEGYSEDAADIREALARGSMFDEIDALVLEMETTDELPTRRDTEALEDQLQTSGPDAARIMREYLAARRLAKDLPDEGQLIAAQALLRESTENRAVNSLWHEVLLSHAAMGDMEAMLAMLVEVSNMPEPDLEAIENSVIELIVERENDAALIVFSTHLVEQSRSHRLSLTQRRAVWERLSFFGLAELASFFDDDEMAMPEPLLTPSQNWAAAADEDTSVARIARRMAEFESDLPASALQHPDEVRATLQDSQSLRTELSDMLGLAAAN